MNPGWPLIAVGIITAVANTVDFFLTDPQRRRLTDWAETAWLWLAYHRGERLKVSLSSSGFQRFVAIAALLGVLPFVALTMFQPYFYEMGRQGSAIIDRLAEPLRERLTRGAPRDPLATPSPAEQPQFEFEMRGDTLYVGEKSPRRAGLIPSLISLGLLPLAVPLFLGAHKRVRRYVERALTPGRYAIRIFVSFLLSELIGGGVILATISIPPRGNWIANVFLFVAMAAVLEMAALLLMSLIALPVVITLSAALSVLWLLRFLLHPIATHPKGPIYAIAGLLVLVGQLLRFAIGSP